MRVSAKKYFMLFVLVLCVGQKTICQSLKPQKNVAILIFNDVQIIDYTCPYEVFINASSNNYNRFNVYTVAQTSDPIRTIGDMTVVPRYNFSNHPTPDVLIVPGGWGAYAERKKPEVIQWIQHQAKDAEIVLSVCNGAFFLASCGLLDGLSATSTAGAIDRLKDEVPSLKPVYDERFVDNGKIVTSAGLSAGIDASLHVVEKLLGKGWAQNIAVSLEYNWKAEPNYARALLADRQIAPTWWLLPETDFDFVRYEGDKDHWISETIVHTTDDAKAVSAAIEKKLTEHKRIQWEKKSRWNLENNSLQSIWSSKREGVQWNYLFSIESTVDHKIKLTMKTVRDGSPLKLIE
jgi:putative intracellular protease/amidase